MNLLKPERLPPSNMEEASLSSTLQRLFPILAITAFGFILRLVKVDSSFWYDEGYTGYLSTQSLGDLLHFTTKEDIQSPLYYLTVWFWAQIFPTDWGIRLFSVLIGVISIPLLYSLASKMFNRQVGLVASAFLALSPFHLNYSIEARPYSLYILFGIAALWFLVIALESNKNLNGWWLCYSFTATLMLYIHHIGAMVFMGMVAFHFCLIWPMDRKRFFQWIGFSTVPVVLFLPWISVVLSQIGMSKDILRWIPKTNLATFLKMMIRYIYFLPYDRPGLIIIALWIMPHLVLLGLAPLISESASRKKVIALTAFAVVPITVVTIYSCFVQPIFVTRYLAPVVITLMILPAIPVVSLKKTRWHSVLVLITVLALILPFINCLHYIKLPRTVNWRGAAKEIKQNMKDDDIILVFPKGALYVFNFYFQDNEGSVVKTINDSADFNSLDFEFLKGRRRLWIIRNQVLNGDATLKVVNWFDQKYNIIMKDNQFKWLDIILVNLTPKSEPAINE
ncbi:MAG: glycosyltransferase family 39 protein [Sedimentisphaerales bacterium]|nr:glycosyltransferase family 39 protein [Sedimentisphaerales bacterium]